MQSKNRHLTAGGWTATLLILSKEKKGAEEEAIYIRTGDAAALEKPGTPSVAAAAAFLSAPAVYAAGWAEDEGERAVACVPAEEDKALGIPETASLWAAEAAICRRMQQQQPPPQNPLTLELLLLLLLLQLV